MDSWRETVGSPVWFSRTGVSLDIRNPCKAGAPTSVFVLYTNGQLSLNRGYLVDGSRPSDVLDDQIRRVFPDGRWGAGSYDVTIGAPEPAAVQTFHRWLVDHFAELAGLPATSAEDPSRPALGSSV